MKKARQAGRGRALGQRVLFDTNVVLDLLLARAPFDRAAVELASRVARGEIEGVLCATSVTTIAYIAGRQVGAARAKDAVDKVLSLFRVAAVTETVLRSAMALGFDDFEDAVVQAAAVEVGATAIVTRDREGFVRSSLAIFAPDELVAALDAG